MRASEDSPPSVLWRFKAGQILLDGVLVEQVADELPVCLPTVRRYRR